MVLLISLPKANHPSSAFFDVSVPSSIQLPSTESDGIRNDILLEIPISPTGYTSNDRVPKKIRPKTNHRGDLGNDGQSRRELLVKGKAGSRRRKRYENAHFLNVPNSQPPLPSDWEVHPTYPVYHNVPYYLAPLWDSKYQRAAEERAGFKSSSSSSLPSHGKVSQDLKLALKKAKGARSLLQYLETEIRNFIQQSTTSERCSANDMDTEDEEIVFIGRDKDGRGITMSDEPIQSPKPKQKTEKLVFESRPQAGGGGFMRWLVHEIAEYYGLESYSETVDKNFGRTGKGARNIIVGFQNESDIMMPRYRDTWSIKDGISQMPRPLWGLV